MAAPHPDTHGRIGMKKYKPKYGGATDGLYHCEQVSAETLDGERIVFANLGPEENPSYRMDRAPSSLRRIYHSIFGEMRSLGKLSFCAGVDPFKDPEEYTDAPIHSLHFFPEWMIDQLNQYGEVKGSSRALPFLVEFHPAKMPPDYVVAGLNGSLKCLFKQLAWVAGTSSYPYILKGRQRSFYDVIQEFPDPSSATSDPKKNTCSVDCRGKRRDRKSTFPGKRKSPERKGADKGGSNSSHSGKTARG